MTQRRILVTGASGFLGRHVTGPLLVSGYQVHAVSRRPVSSRPGMVVHQADLLDEAAITALVASVRPHSLLHLAWDVTPGRFWTAPENLDWVAASLHLYRAFVSSGGRRIVVAGTCAEYDWHGDGKLEEDAPLRPATLYGAAKHGLHQMLAAAAKQDDVMLAWGRLFFLYGPHEATARMVSSVAISLLRGEPALVGDGLAVREIMHVADAAAALVTVLNSTYSGPINIACGQPVAVATVVSAVAAHVGRPDLVQFNARPTPAGEPPVLMASGRLLAELGFRPGFGLDAGLVDTLEWWWTQLSGSLLPDPHVVQLVNQQQA